MGPQPDHGETTGLATERVGPAVADPAARASTPAAGGPGSGMAASGMAALPVAVAVSDDLDRGVCDHVEGTLGWQPVDAATAELVPPRLRLVTPDAPPTDDAVPCVLLVPPGTTPAAAAAAGARHRAVATLAWPAERDALAERVAPLLAGPREASDGGGRVLRVGGAAGGVGTSTVTLALAGLAAWMGARTLAVVGPDAPAAGVRRVAADALSSPDLWERSSPLRGVPGARAVATAPGPAVRLDAVDADVVVRDVGRHGDVDVLVCRPDRAALHALAVTTAAAVVVNGHGAATPRALARAADGRRLVRLPWSMRVARAGLAGRVPTSLPGAWLRALRPIAPRPPHRDEGG